MTQIRALAKALSLVLVLGVLCPRQAGATVIYWTGGQDAQWSTVNAGSSNWSTDFSGTPDYTHAPLSGDDVHFYATGASHLATTLGANFSIRSLTMDTMSTSAVSIGGSNILTLTGTANSLVMNAGAGALTITSTVALGAANVWTNGAVTFDDSLPVGHYQVVGFRAESVGLVAARLVFKGYG